MMGKSNKRNLVVEIILSSLLGVVLGLISKWLDCTPAGTAPLWMEWMDVRNLLGRLSIWLVLAMALAMTARTAKAAAIRVFSFFVAMLIAYYAYTKWVAGFFPFNYVMLWVGLAFISPGLAALCWYAKKPGKWALLLCSGMTGFLFIQAFSFGVWYFSVRYWPEVLLWGIGLWLCRRESGRMMAWMLLISLCFAVFWKFYVPISFG